MEDAFSIPCVVVFVTIVIMAILSASVMSTVSCQGSIGMDAIHLIITVLFSGQFEQCHWCDVHFFVPDYHVLCARNNC